MLLDMTENRPAKECFGVYYPNNLHSGSLEWFDAVLMLLFPSRITARPVN